MIFNEFKNDIVNSTKAGTSKEAIGMKAFGNYKLPYFDIDKQIVTKVQFVNMQHSKIDINSELTHQLDLIKQLRQAFLREAMQGKLVKSTNTNDTGQQLLAKIKAEKAKLIAEKKLKKEKVLSPISEDEIPFEIPEHWAWCRLGDLGSFRRGPFGSALTKGIFVKTGYKVYEQKNAIYDNHTLGEYYITSEKFKELKGFVVKPNDLIVSCSGATLGRIAEIPEGAEEGIINQALMRMTLFQSGITNSFFIRLFRSPYMQKKIFDKAWGSAIPNMVGLVEIKKILIPLPPLHDQEQIVAKLEELMAYCDGLEQSIKESQGYNEMLLQQVLREALQGEKV
jgi:type I restriction enzyme S subunit